jgi:outer membrane lipoprotein-sorting protein
LTTFVHILKGSKSMQKLLLFALGFGLIAFVVSAQESQTPKNVLANEIMQAADQYRGEEGWGFSLQVVDLQKGEQEVKILSSYGFEVAGRLFGTFPSRTLKAFVQFTAPQSEVGKKMLMDDRIYWMFFPQTKNLVRITPAQRLAGLATAADIASTNFAIDYEGQFIAEENVLDMPCYKLKLSPRHEEVAYGSLLYWIEKGSYKPSKIEYYSVTNQLLKTAYFRKFQMATAIGKVKAHEVFMIDAIQTGRVTRMLYDNMRLEQRPNYFFEKEKFTTMELAASPKPEVTPLQLVRNADLYRGGTNWGFDLKIVDMQKEKEGTKVLSDNGFTGAVRLFGEQPNWNAKCLCLFTEPQSEAGKKMLMDGEVYWLFFPNTKNLVRITPAQRLAGLASAADVAGTNFEIHYDAEFANPKEEVVLGKYCYKLILTAKTDKDVAYYKLHYWIDKDSMQPVRSDYFSVTGEHIKTAYYRDFKMAAELNQIMAHEIFILDPLQEGHATRMLYSNLRVEDKPEYVFRKEELGK